MDRVLDLDEFVFPPWFGFQNPAEDEPPRPADRALAGEGVLDCEHCPAVVLRSILDLRKHYREEHPLALSTRPSDGDTLRERLKDAEKDALTERIENEDVPDVEGENA